MILNAGNDNETLNDGSAAYINGYECGLPDEIRQKIDDLKKKMRIIWKDYLEELKKERAYGKYQNNCTWRTLF